MSEDLRAFLYHPIAAGMAGIFSLVCTLLVPIGAGYVLLTVGNLALKPAASYVSGVAMTVLGVWTFNKVLYGTLVYDWIAEFIRWAASVGLPVPGGETA